MPDAIAVGRTNPYIAHLYGPAWKFGGANAALFKKILGAPVGLPTIKYTINAGHHPLTLDMPAQDGSALRPATGDVVLLSENLGDGSTVASGVVGDVPDDLDVKVKHQIELMPFTQELGVTPHEVNYTAATDVAQMIRDAVVKCKHIYIDTATCPNTGITGIFDFSVTGTALRVAEECLKMAGSNYVFFVDELGRFYFGQASVATATYTVKAGQDYEARKFRSPIDKLYNFFIVEGGVPPGQTGTPQYSLACVYDDGHLVPCTSLTIPAPFYAPSNALGIRARKPNFRIPKLLNQTTLNNMTQTLGAMLNRRQSKIEINLVNFAKRINLSRPGGASMKYWEPSVLNILQSFAGGGMSPVYVVSDVEITGPRQKVVLTDLVADGDQLQYELDKMNDALAENSSNSVQLTAIGVVTAPMLYGGTAASAPTPTIPAFYP